MIIRFLMLCAVWLATAPSYAQHTYTFDKSHTSILFLIDHAGFSKFIGEFLEYDGTIILDENHPEKSRVDITINPKGISTDLPDFDKKLQGAPFFNSATYPTATFQSTGVVLQSDTQAKVTGNFTLRGITKPLTLDVTLNKMGYDKWSKKQKAGFSITTTFRRSEWGFDTYVPAVGDDVTLQIETEIVRPLNAEEAEDKASPTDKKGTN